MSDSRMAPGDGGVVKLCMYGLYIKFCRKQLKYVLQIGFDPGKQDALEAPDPFDDM